MSDLNNDKTNPMVDLSTSSNKYPQETEISTLVNAYPLQYENDELSQLSKLILSDHPDEQTDDSPDSNHWHENQRTEQPVQVASSESYQHSWSHSTIGRDDARPTITSPQHNPLDDYEEETYVQTVNNRVAQTPATSHSSSNPYVEYETDYISPVLNTQTKRISQSASKSKDPPIERNKHSTNEVPKYGTHVKATNLQSRASHGRSTQHNPDHTRLYKYAFSDLSKNRFENQRRVEPAEARPILRKVDPFAEWIRSRSRGDSLWFSDMHRRSLLAYIGKIYSAQRDQMYSRFDQLQASMPTLDDLDILHEILQRTKQQQDAQKSLNKWEDRSRIDRRIKELQIIFEFDRNNRPRSSPFIVTPSGLEQLIDRQTIQSYFDFGCGDGTITASVGAYLGLNKENIFGGDVFGGQNAKITFVKLEEDQSIIHLPAGQVDLITSFVTFHHVSQIEEALRELARILRPGGYLILREHDCKTEHSLSAKYLHFVHAIMMIARVGEFASSAKDNNDGSDYLPSEDTENNSIDWPEQKSRIIDYTKTIHYRTSAEWQKKLENVGFHLCATLSYGTNEASNPQKLFYAVYQLINKG